MTTRLPENKDLEKKVNYCKKGYFLTYPRCEAPKDKCLDHLLSLGAAVVVVAQETHKDGVPHLHAWVEYEVRKHITNPRFFDYQEHHCNIGGLDDKVQTRAKALAYITKQDKEPAVFGIDLEEEMKARKNHRKIIGQQLINEEITVEQAVEENPELIFQYIKLKENVELFTSKKRVKSFDPSKRKCYWIYGTPGIGKSYAIRKLFPDVYMKQQNKWWDGYINQDVVLIDDVDSTVLKHYLKIWADPYKFIGERKGGKVEPVYKVLFVTSNWQIHELFKTEDKKFTDAIDRRFKSIDADEFINDETNYFDLEQALDI